MLWRPLDAVVDEVSLEDLRLDGFLGMLRLPLLSEDPTDASIALDWLPSARGSDNRADCSRKRWCSSSAHRRLTSNTSARKARNRSGCASNTATSV